MNNSTTTAAKSTKNLTVVSKAQQKALSIPTKKQAPKVETKAPTLKAKTKSNGLHSALLDCNNKDKEEIFSLAGALKRLQKQMQENETYKAINPIFTNEAVKFDTILKYVAPRCIENKKFSPYQVGLAINKYLKTVL